MIDLSIVIPVYNPKEPVLQNHFNELINYKNKDNVELVIVDDGSNPPYIPKQEYPKLKLARIKQDIKWNVVGAVNLGISIAKGDWILVLGEDHFIKRRQLDKIMNLSLSKNHIYLFERFFKDGTPRNKRAPGTCLINREDFWKLGGYDEDFCGGQGYSDWFLLGCPHPWSEYKDKISIAKSKGMRFSNLDAYLTIENKFAKSYKKNLRNNMPLYQSKMSELSKGKYIHPKILNFEWEIIKTWEE